MSSKASSAQLWMMPKPLGVEPPAIICIGRSVLMRQVLDWRSLEAGAAPRNLDPLDRGRPAESA